MDLVLESMRRVRFPSAIKRRLVTLALALAVSIPTFASAGNLGTREEATYLNSGIETGLTLHHGGGGFGTTLGLRMSLNDVVQYLLPMEWEGVYGHVQRDFKTESWRSGLGYGVGVFIFGLEAGVAVHGDERDTDLGVEGAVLGTLGLVGVHVRHTRFFERPSVTEIGLRAALPVRW